MTNLRGKVLLVGNDALIRTECRQSLESAGYRFVWAKNRNQALEKIRRESFDVALLDLGVPGKEILKKLKEESPNMAVIVVGGNPDIGSAVISAVEAIKLGAFDYVPKPFSTEVLLDRVGKAAKAVMRALETACIQRELEKKMLSQVLIGRSEAMNRVMRLVRQAALVDSPVLITGETGAGKKVVARAIHNLSRRSDKRFVRVDCSTLEERVFERELFGHARQSFSGMAENSAGKIELAGSGTLFLDEVSKLSPRMQAGLLRGVQEHEIARAGSALSKKTDVRILSATSRDLQREVREGRFREDLFYRLSVVSIHVPPLRERLEDIPALANYYLKKLASGIHRPEITVSGEAMRFLKMYEWPGNVRQLISAIEYAMATFGGDTIGPKDLPHRILGSHGPVTPEGGSLARLEQNEILNALKQFQGNKTRAAQYLGINRKTLREKMQRYGISF